MRHVKAFIGWSCYIEIIYLTDVQFNSLKADAEELVKVLTHRCKKLDNVGGSEK